MIAVYVCFDLQLWAIQPSKKTKPYRVMAVCIPKKAVFTPQTAKSLVKAPKRDSTSCVGRRRWPNFEGHLSVVHLLAPEEAAIAAQSEVGLS